MRLKKVIGALGVVLALGMAKAAWADIPSDSFTLTVTPSGTRGVNIATTTFDYGSVTLGLSTMTAAIPMTSTGTLGNIEYDLTASIGGGWALSTDGTADAADELVVKGLYNSTAPGAFGAGTTDLINGTPRGAGSGGADSNYEGNQDMDTMALDTPRNLWVRFTLPPTSSVGVQQTVTVTVTAGLAD